MAKRSKKSNKLSSTTMSAHAQIMQAKRRRDTVLLGLAGVLAIGAIGALLWFFTTLENREEDYSIVGMGEPVIVQIHQLYCHDCDILRANTKRAMNQINDDRLHYRIAYLHKPEGIAFASKHGAARQTTLVLFDKFGRKQGVYYGVQEVDMLVTRFNALL